jgi:hypothetical protein
LIVGTRSNALPKALSVLAGLGVIAGLALAAPGHAAAPSSAAERLVLSRVHKEGPRTQHRLPLHRAR